jgi:hypothetical protein
MNSNVNQDNYYFVVPNGGTSVINTTSTVGLQTLGLRNSTDEYDAFNLNGEDMVFAVCDDFENDIPRTFKVIDSTTRGSSGSGTALWNDIVTNRNSVHGGIDDVWYYASDTTAIKIIDNPTLSAAPGTQGFTTYDGNDNFSSSDASFKN